MANGKVRIGFSKPYAAKYTDGGNGTVTYSDGLIMGRGVSVDVSANSNGGTNFYADNAAAESASGVFSGASATLTIDGMFIETEMFMHDLTTSTVTVGTDTVTMYDYDEDANPPYVGIGYIEKWQSEGEITYVPVILTKCRMNTPEESVETQGESLNFQTQPLVFDVMRDDTATHKWKRKGEDMDTEAEAEAVIKAILNIS